MDELIDIISEYESDTFNAKGLALTSEEAKEIAERLLERLCQIVAEGGTLRCDGDVLADYLDGIRSE
jgi:hypothetical protein